jgi:hypothetical protein
LNNPHTNAPEADEISAADAARYLGLTNQTIGTWARKPGAPARVAGRHVWVQWPAFARWREAELVAAAQPGDVEALRAEKLRVEIDHARLELARAQGELVTVADYERALGVMCDRFVARLRALPVRLAHLGDAVEAEAEAEAEAIIAELHALDEDVVEVPEEAPDIAPGTVPDIAPA